MLDEKALLLTVISGLCTAVGGGIALLLRGQKKGVLGVMLGLSGGMMITVSLVDMLPTAFSLMVGKLGVLGMVFSLVSGILFGLLMNLSLPEGGLDRLGVLSMVSLMAHNLPEGIAVYLGGSQDLALGLRLAVAIGIHNIPEGIAIALPICYGGGSTLRAFGYALLSGLAEPVGGVIGYLLGRWIFLAYLMAGVAGLMLYLAIGEILPSGVRYGGSSAMTFGAMVGIVLMVISIFFGV